MPRDLFTPYGAPRRGQSGPAAGADQAPPDGFDYRTLTHMMDQGGPDDAPPVQSTEPGLPRYLIAIGAVLIIAAILLITKNVWLPLVHPAVPQSIATVAQVQDTTSPGIPFPQDEAGTPDTRTGTPEATSTTATKAEGTLQAQGTIPDGSTDWSGVAQKVTPDLVTVKAENGSQATGIVVGQNGEVLVNAGAVDPTGLGPGRVHIVTPAGKSVRATFLGADAISDLALFRAAAPAGLQPVSLANSNSAQIGDPAMSIGTAGSGRVFTVGIISAISLPIQVPGQGVISEDGETSGIPGLWFPQIAASQQDLPVIQSDTATIGHSTGGPMIDRQGQLIGFSSTRLGVIAAGGGAKLTTGLPSNVVREVALQLAARGNVQRAWTGVTAGTTTAQVRGQIRQAPVIQSIDRGAPGAQAGLEIGDILLSANGKVLSSSEDLAQVMMTVASGDTVTFKVLRNENTLEASVVLGTAP